MFSTSSLITLACALSQTAVVLSATPPPLLDSKGVSTHLLKVDGHEIRVGLVPIASSLAAATPPPSASGTLSKRVTQNGCFDGCPAITCTNSLSTDPDPPLSADCTALANAITALATSDETQAPPCNGFNVNCPNFTVAPGFEQQYSLGTCLTGFANLGPVNGPSISFCNFLIGGTLPSLYRSCVTNAGNTGGFCNSDPAGPFFAIEVRHI